MKSYLYLSVDLLSISVPFIFSFFTQAKFYKQWKYYWPANIACTAVFLAWDMLFTHLGVWGFNPDYLTGIYIGNLPLEEVLFFICIPYACTFTYFALNYLVEKDYLFPHQELISSALIIGLLIIGMHYMERLYTSVTFLFLAFLLAFQMIKLRPRYMGRFYFAFLVILVPFFIVNGILTGTGIDKPVVWYNNAQNLGIRMGTIPFEDTFYGMLMILMNITVYEWLQERERWKHLRGK
jgi:lycopene cyclase domain-containing protein